MVGLLVVVLAACTGAPATAVPPTPLNNQPSDLLPTPTLQLPPEPSPTTIMAVPTATPLADTGWQLLQAGLERRSIRVLDENGRQTEQLTLLRLDPNLFTFAIGYSPGQPKPLATWQAETGALIVVNGGFFTEEFLATGLIVVDGVTSGSSYQGFGGMVTMSEGSVAVRSLVERPYQPTETFTHALQSFPMLVLNGEPAYQNADFDAARRTAIGVDADGRILLILASWGDFTLAEFSSYLASADFGLVNALNLDGGTSTGLILAEPAESIPAFVAVPSVITISPRQN